MDVDCFDECGNIIKVGKNMNDSFDCSKAEPKKLYYCN